METDRNVVDSHSYSRISVKILHTEVEGSFPDWQYSVCIESDVVLTLGVVDNRGSIFGVLLGSILCVSSMVDFNLYPLAVIS